MKTETLFARVTPELAQKVKIEAARVGESDAYVLREALREYFAGRASSAATAGDAMVSAVISEAAATRAPGLVDYGSKPKAARRKATPPSPDSKKKAL